MIEWTYIYKHVVIQFTEINTHPKGIIISYHRATDKIKMRKKQRPIIIQKEKKKPKKQVQMQESMFVPNVPRPRLYLNVLN